MDPELFPEVPEDLSGLSDEELADLQSQLSARAREITAGEAEVGELSARDVLERMTAARADYARIGEEITARAAGAEEFTTQAAELAAEMGVSDAEEAAAESGDEGDGDGDGDEGDAGEAAAEGAEELSTESGEGDSDDSGDGEGDEAAADVTASRAEPRLPVRARRFRPRAVEERGVELLASMAIPRAGVRSGDSLSERTTFCRAIAEAWEMGISGDTIVASADIPYPTERQLKVKDGVANWDKIQAVVDPGAFERDEVLASGGVCAPFPAIYDYPIYGSTSRPVRDALARFAADRGGVQVPGVINHADVTGAITVKTQADDALGGTFAAKNCLALDCPEWTDVSVAAVAACVTVGNFNARAWPEGVARFNDNVAVAHAVAGETNLLGLIGAGSTALTDEAKYGAVASLFQGILKAAARMRSANRMAPEQTLRVLLPSWVPDALIADLAMSQFDRFKVRSDIARILGAANVAVTWYLDEETGTGMIFDTTSPGGNLLAEFPLSVVWYLFPEGAWLFLDMGRLDVGVTRDSVLNETNDFAIFYETFEGAALVGIESIKVTSTICVSGEVAIAADNILTCST